MRYKLTQQQVDVLEAFIDGRDGVVFDPEAAQALLFMSAALGTALMKENRRLAGENKSARRRLDRIAEKKSSDRALLAAQDAFEGTGLDSVDVALATLFCLQRNGAGVNKKKLMLVVYLAYCSFLYNCEKRLFLEGPVAIESGPIFWKVSNKITSAVTPVGDESWKALAAQSPAIAKFIDNFTRKYGDYSEVDLEKFVLRSAPYKSAMEAARGKGRKSCVISDRDIWLWRDSIKKLNK